MSESEKQTRMDALKQYERAFVVRDADIDRTGMLTLPGALYLMQETAGEHAERLGAGYDVLRKRNTIWVISRVHVQFERLPKTGERVLVTTWPSGFNRIVASREVKMTVGEETVMRASSFWALLDLTTGRPAPLPEALPAEFPDNRDLPVHFCMPSRLVTEGASHPLPFLITEHYIDRNDHLNNCRYAEIAMDWLAHELGRTVHVRDIVCNYVLATAPNATLTAAGFVTGNEFKLEMTGDDGKRHFQAAGTLFDE